MSAIRWLVAIRKFGVNVSKGSFVLIQFRLSNEIRGKLPLLTKWLYRRRQRHKNAIRRTKMKDLLFLAKYYEALAKEHQKTVLAHKK